MAKEVKMKDLLILDACMRIADVEGEEKLVPREAFMEAKKIEDPDVFIFAVTYLVRGRRGGKGMRSSSIARYSNVKLTT